MRRSPFYAYPDFPYSFYAPPAEAAYQRPRRSFPPSSPATPPSPTARSVIHVPVFDSAPSTPSLSPPRPQPIDFRPPSSPPAFSAGPVIDRSSAAVIIQSCFRGFCVRRHHPLLHLRSIAEARKKLEELQSELKSPGFSLKVRASEKERLRFSENIMAIILRLDAIQGSIAEVRRQRKEATKKAIKLQDALDAIMMQNVETADLKPTDGPFPNGGIIPDGGDALLQQSEEFLCSDVDMVQGDGHAISKESAMDVNTVEEEPASPEKAVADKCIPNLGKDNIMDIIDQNVSSGEGEPGYFELVPQAMAAEAMNEAEQEISGVTEEKVGSDAMHAVEELNNGIDLLCLESPKNYIQSNALVAKVEDAIVDDMIIAGQGSAKMESSNGSYICMNVVKEAEDSTSQDVEGCPDTPAAEEKCDYPRHGNAAHENQVHCLSTASDRLADGKCSLDFKGSPTLPQHGHKMQSNAAHGNCNDKEYSYNEVKVQPSTSGVGPLLGPDSTLLEQLAEDSKQLKALVGKLLVQNKAQSKVLCALGERLELLEHQQQLGCRRNQQNMREKRKLKKRAKRSVKYHDCE